MATIYSVLICLFLQLLAVQGSLAANSVKHDFAANENNRELIQSFADNFPTITRDLHPQELKLKAHSSIHLGEKQPEIFASLESVLTPYFQEILGENLIAYDLKVKYSEGEETDVADIIVTNMLVSCILTVRSESVEQLKYHTHDNANKWFFDFFDGLNVYKFLGQLRDNDIEVGELVFEDEEFRSPLLNGGNVIVKDDLDVGSISLGGPGSGHSGGHAGAIAGAFVGVLVVGGVLAYRYKEKIPWDKIQEKSIGGGSSATTGSLGDSDGSSSKRTAMSRLSTGIDKGIQAGKRLSANIKKNLPTKDEVNSKLDVAKSKIGPKLDAAKSTIGPKLDVAKSKLGFIQERVSMYKNKPSTNTSRRTPQAEEAPDSPTTSSDHKKKKNHHGTTTTTTTSLLDSNPYNPFQPIIPRRAPPSEATYSVGGDFGVGEEYEASTQRSPTISAYSGYGREIVFGNDDDDDDRLEEFSMPDDYNTVVAGDDYSVHCHSILGLMDQVSVADDRTISSYNRSGPTTSHDDDDDDSHQQQQHQQQQQAQRRQRHTIHQTVPNSPFFSDMDEWSMDGYSLASRPAAPTRHSSGSRSHLNMPHLP